MRAPEARPRGLADRLEARAFALVVDGVPPVAAGEALLDMAREDTAALQRAHGRVEARLLDRPARLAQAAELALRAAVVIASDRDGHMTRGAVAPVRTRPPEAGSSTEDG